MDKNISGVENLLLKSAAIELPDSRSFHTQNKFAGVVRKVLKKSPKLKGDFFAILNEYEKIEDIEIVGSEYLISESDRSPRDLNFKSAALKVEYDIRGKTKTGKRQNDKGNLRVDVIRVGGLWKIKSIGTEYAERVTLMRKSAFGEKTASSGLNKVAIHERSEAIRRGGYAISLTDINNDGYLDIFSGSAKGSQLLFGSGAGQWTLSKDLPILRPTAVKTAIFSDFDNDGDQDAFFTLFEYDEGSSDLA